MLQESIKTKQKKELELYIHIPFCVQKCRYCDFLSAPAEEAVQDAYMEALCREIIAGSKEFPERLITTIFIGGGTPSSVNPEWIGKVMQAIKEHYYLAEDAEITMEMNPGTVTAGSLAMYRTYGINRLSIGLQSTNAEELKVLGRIHTYEQFEVCYNFAREVGFENINVDIMSALPKQSLESYADTLQKVTNLLPPPEHISAYSLIVEEGTPFYEAYEAGDLKLPEEDTERKMYEFTGEFLSKKGYERYEISNYAMPGKACRHNIGYWERKDYLGFGIGAASLVDNRRFCNGSELLKYIETPCAVREEMQELSKGEQMEETMFLGLRMTKGVAVNAFERCFDVGMEQVYGKVIRKHREDGLLQVNVHGEETYISLTAKGMDVSNYVMADFLEPGNF